MIAKMFRYRKTAFLFIFVCFEQLIWINAFCTQASSALTSIADIIFCRDNLQTCCHKSHRSRRSPLLRPILRHSAAGTHTAFPDFMGWSNSWETTPTRVNFFCLRRYLQPSPRPSKATAVPVKQRATFLFWANNFTKKSIFSFYGKR